LLFNGNNNTEILLFYILSIIKGYFDIINQKLMLYVTKYQAGLVDNYILIIYFSNMINNERLVSDVNIKEITSLTSPRAFRELYPLKEKYIHQIHTYRQQIQDILDNKDPRMLAIVGPCSIHDESAAYEYAEKLRNIQEKVKDQILLIMRVYFEKPRTTIGWKGLITDPDLNDSFNISKGLSKAREIMIKITEMGLPIGSEILDPIVPQYISDLISWAAIGARTTESQVHREISSGLSMPVGFKNGTDGNFAKAMNAIQSSRHPHSFIGIDENGLTSICRTKGNHYGHLILRGGENGPNYHIETIEDVEESIEQLSYSPSIIIDCSHANSGKKFQKQERVLKSIIDTRLKGYPSIKGFMLESNLFEGNQKIPKDLKDLQYGVSITDPCISWDTTEELLLSVNESLKH